MGRTYVRSPGGCACDCGPSVLFLWCGVHVVTPFLYRSHFISSHQLKQCAPSSCCSRKCFQVSQRLAHTQLPCRLQARGMEFSHWTKISHLPTKSLGHQRSAPLCCGIDGCIYGCRLQGSQGLCVASTLYSVNV